MSGDRLSLPSPYAKILVTLVLLPLMLALSGCGSSSNSASPTPLRISSTPVIIPSPTPWPTYVVPRSTPVPATALAFRVNGRPIYLSEYERLHMAFERVLWESNHIDPKSKAGKQAWAAQAVRVKEFLVQREILTPYALAKKLYLTDADLKTIIKKFGGDAKFKQLLANNQMDVNAYKWQITLQNIASNLLHGRQFHVDQISLKDIVVGSKAVALSVQQQLLKGSDFGQLAAQVSLDQNTKNRGGDMGFVTPGQLPAAVDAVAFKLKLNTISDPICTSYGCYIIKVTSKTPNVLATGNALQSAQLQYWVSWYSAMLKKAKVDSFVLVN